MLSDQRILGQARPQVERIGIVGNKKRIEHKKIIDWGLPGIQGAYISFSLKFLGIIKTIFYCS